MLRAAAALLLALPAAACATPVSDPPPGPPLRGAPDGRPGADDAPRPRLNLPLPTFGGAQLWADLRWRAGWRLQENVATGHCRLLDPANVRRAWGSRAACLAILDERVPPGAPSAAPDRPLVVLLHGMGRTRVSFARMRRELEAAGWRSARRSYPSTRRSIPEHAAWLEGVLDGLAADGEARSLCFVTHSLGGILVRSALARQGSWRSRLEVERIVMLGPPNQGSAFADRLAGLRIFRWLYGDTGVGLVPEEVRRIPPPDRPFLIVAGARGDGRGWNPLLPGDDDGVVRLAETHLEGAASHVVVRCLHAFLAGDREAIAHTLAFLAGGTPRAAQSAGGDSTKS
jgi:hypothetical protein